jgi:hypothetical protein
MPDQVLATTSETMNIDRATETQGKRDPLTEYTPRASTQTLQILGRLTASGPRNLRPDSSLLGEVLSSLKTDQFVLRGLQEALRRYRGDEIPADLLSKAVQRCCQLEMECDVLGANVALMCGATEKASMVLQRLIRQDASIIVETLRPLLFKLLVSVAWVVRDQNTAESFFQTARMIDTQGRYAGYLDGLKRLLQARSELQTGRSDVAVRVCQALDHETKPGDPLKVLALELQSDAFRQLSDLEREQKVLEDWEYLLRSLPNGPCDLAVGAETTSTSPGILGESRSEEILQHYSRLALLYERDPKARRYAKGIYAKFLNTAYHKWVDPTVKEMGSIEQRLACMEREIPGAEYGPRPDPPKPAGMAIIEPGRSYGRVSDKALEDLLKQLTTMPVAAYCAVVIGQVDMKEQEFRIQESLGTPLAQLLHEMSLIITEGSPNLFTFQPEKTSVLWKGQPMEWLVLSHQEQAPDIRSLSFGLRLDKVGEHIVLALYALFKYRPPLSPDAQDELAGVLRKKLEELGGYNAIEGMVVELVKRAAKRVDQKAGRLHHGSGQKGPIRL